MTIHHDKMAYGRLARTSEELSEDRLAEMLKELNAEKEQNGSDDATAGNEENTDK